MQYLSDTLYLLSQAAEATKDGGGWLNISAPWLALFGTIFGGVGLKLVESFLNKPSRRDSTPAEIRDELRKQIEGLKEDAINNLKVIDETEKEMLTWRDKYYELVLERNKQQREILDYISEITALREQLKDRGK